MFKTPSTPVGAPLPDGGRAPASAEKVSPMPRNIAQLVEEDVKAGDTAAAFRTLSTILSGRYTPDRQVYAMIWTAMIGAKSGAHATQCYEMLKLLQAAGVASDTAWCPRTEADYALLVECLRETKDGGGAGAVADDGDADEDADAEPQSQGRGGRRKSGPLSALKGAHAKPAKKAKKATARASPSSSEYYHLLLRFIVNVLAENARVCARDPSKSAAVLDMTMAGGEMGRWREVATLLFEGIASRRLARHVSDTYFALLHLLVEVCGRSNAARASMVEVWLGTTGVTLLEEGGGGFNDSLAELLQRAEWWSFKLCLVNQLLVSKFVQSDVKRTDLLETATSTRFQADRMCHVYFNLRPHDRQAQSSQQHDYDAESLVILIASAWQCAIHLRHDNATLWNTIQATQSTVSSARDAFERKVKSLARMRGNKDATFVRTEYYLTLLAAMMQSIYMGIE